MIKFATIGTSKITEHFLEAAALVPQLSFFAAYSRSAERAKEFAEKHGAARSFTSLEALAACREIDAVYIASPNVFHAEQCRVMLENGKHILCEKPIATSLSEYKKVYRLAREKGLIYIEAMMSANVPWSAKVKAALGEIGNIALARIDFCQRSSRYDSFIAGNPQNIFDMSLHAGTLNDLGIYCVYAAAELFGRPKEISATASFFNNGADSAGGAVFDYGSFPAVLSYSKAGQSAAGSEIIGDGGTLRIGSISQMTSVELIKNGENRIIVPDMPKAQVMQGEAERFAALIAEPRKNADIAEQLHLLAETAHGIMDEIKRSAGITYPAAL